MWMWIVVALVGLFVLAFLWGLLSLRRSVATAREAILKVGLADVDRLRAECEAVFRDVFSERLELSDLQGSARILSARLDEREKLKQAFLKPGFWWYYVLPVGAWLGELLRVHAKGQWKESSGGGLEMTLPLPGGEATTFPFDKVLKQGLSGDKGDLLAYIEAATRIDEVAAGLPE